MILLHNFIMIRQATETTCYIIKEYHQLTIKKSAIQHRINKFGKVDKKGIVVLLRLRTSSCIIYFANKESNLFWYLFTIQICSEILLWQFKPFLIIKSLHTIIIKSKKNYLHYKYLQKLLVFYFKQFGDYHKRKIITKQR